MLPRAGRSEKELVNAAVRFAAGRATHDANLKPAQFPVHIPSFVGAGHPDVTSGCPSDCVRCWKVFVTDHVLVSKLHGPPTFFASSPLILCLIVLQSHPRWWLKNKLRDLRARTADGYQRGTGRFCTGNLPIQSGCDNLLSLKYPIPHPSPLP